MALSAARGVLTEQWTYKVLPLGASKLAYRGGRACIDTSTGYVVPAVAGSATLIPIGYFDETVDNSSGSAGDLSVNVRLEKEISVGWWNNDTGTAVVATDLGKTCYLKDDQTVTMSSTGNSAAGRVWAVDTTDGVAVQVTTV